MGYENIEQLIRRVGEGLKRRQEMKRRNGL